MSEAPNLPQWLPLGYSKEVPFATNVGATAQLTVTLDNFAHLLLSVRATLVYDVPRDVDAQALAFYDDKYLIQVKLGSDTTIVQTTPARNLFGAGAVNWHPLASAYPLAGANNVVISVTRYMGYPPDTLATTTLAVYLETMRGVTLSSGTRGAVPPAPAPGMPGVVYSQ